MSISQQMGDNQQKEKENHFTIREEIKKDYLKVVHTCLKDIRKNVENYFMEKENQNELQINKGLKKKKKREKNWNVKMKNEI